MKTTITILSILALLTSTASFAKKNVKSQRSSAPYGSDYRSNAQAASGWKFGVDLSLLKSIYSDDNGTGSGAFSTGFAAVADHQFDNVFGLTLKIGLANTKYNSEPLQGYQAAVSVNYIMVSGLVRYKINTQLSVAAGPIFDIAAGNGTAEITRSNTRQSATAAVSDLSSIHYGITLEAAYSTPIANSITFEPSVSYDLFLGEGSAPKGDINGSWNNLRLNAGIRFGI
jgi:long-subunit fatty acid transport protein